MQKCTATLMVIAAISAAVLCAEVEQEEELDPFDMVHFDHANMRMRKKATTKDGEPEQRQPPAKEEQQTMDSTPHEDKLSTPVQETQRPPLKDDQVLESAQPPEQEQKTKSGGGSCPALSLFQQFVSRLLRFVGDKVSQVDGDVPTELCLRLRLTPKQLDTLESFKTDHSRDGVFGAHDILNEAVEGAHVLNLDDPSLRYLWVEKYFGVTLDKALQVITVITCVAVLAVVLPKIRLMWILLSGSWISVGMTWFRLYKSEVAKQQEALMKDMPAGCGMNKPDGDYSIWSAIANYVTSQVTFQQDACVTYYEHLVVDPAVMVTPMEALVVAVVQTLLKPMRTIGTEISAFLRALVKDLPLQWQFVSVVMVCIFFTLILLLVCGYRLRIPWLLSIEPSHSDRAVEIKALKDTISHLQTAIANTGSGQPSPPQVCDTVGSVPVAAPRAAAVPGPAVRGGGGISTDTATCLQYCQAPLTTHTAAEETTWREGCRPSQEKRASRPDVRQSFGFEVKGDTDIPHDEALAQTVVSGETAAERKTVQSEASAGCPDRVTGSVSASAVTDMGACQLPPPSPPSLTELGHSDRDAESVGAVGEVGQSGDADTAKSESLWKD